MWRRKPASQPGSEHSRISSHRLLSPRESIAGGCFEQGATAGRRRDEKHAAADPDQVQRVAWRKWQLLHQLHLALRPAETRVGELRQTFTPQPPEPPAQEA